MGKPEAEVEGYLVKRVKEIGGETRKVGWIGRRNAPDRFVMLPGANTLNFWAECKREKGGKLTVGQEREIALLRDHGEIVEVPSSKRDVDDMLDWHMRAHK